MDKRLKQCIKKNLPESKIIISNITERPDTGKAALSIKRFNKYLYSLHLDIVDNSNTDKENLGKKGLHLNLRGSGKLAINFIKKIKSLQKNDMMLAVFKIIILSLR